MSDNVRPFFVIHPGAVITAKQIDAECKRLQERDTDPPIGLIATLFRLCYGNEGTERDAAREIFRDLDTFLKDGDRPDKIAKFLNAARETSRSFGAVNDYLRSIVGQQLVLDEEDTTRKLVEFIQAGDGASASHDSAIEVQNVLEFLKECLRDQEQKLNQRLNAESPADDKKVSALIAEFLSIRNQATNRTLSGDIKKLQTALRNWRLHYDLNLDARLIIGVRHTMRGHMFAGRVLNSLGAPPRLKLDESNDPVSPTLSSSPGAHHLPRLPHLSPVGVEENADWRGRGEKHRECLRTAVGQFIDELGRAANLRDPELAERDRLDPDAKGCLKGRLRPVCYVVNHFSNAVELLELKRPNEDPDYPQGHLPGWVGSLRLPNAVRSTGVARSLPAAFMGVDGEGMRFRSWSHEDLQTTGTGLFTERERVRQLWTLNVSTASWQLLILLNWVVLDEDLTEGSSSVPFDENTSGALDELFRDVRGGVRQLAGWIHASDLDLAQPEEALFGRFGDVAGPLGDAFKPSSIETRQDRLRYLTSEALKRTPVGIQPADVMHRLRQSIVVSSVCTVSAASKEGSEPIAPEYLHYCPDKSELTYHCPQTTESLPVKLGSEDATVLNELTAGSMHTASRVLFLGNQNHRRVFDCKLNADGAIEASIAALSAAWCTPVLSENLEKDIASCTLLNTWVRFSGSHGEHEEEPIGSELHVPIPGALEPGGQRRACGVISIHSDEVGRLGQREAAAVDAIARVYGYTRFARHDPSLSGAQQKQNQELLAKLLGQATDHDHDRIERVLAMANDAVREWTGANMAYFLMRDFRGTCGFRNIGLSCDDQTIFDYVEKRGFSSAIGSTDERPLKESSERPSDKNNPPLPSLAELRNSRAIEAMDRLIKRSLRSHLVPRRQGYTSQMVRENKGCLLLGTNELNQTASQPELLFQLGINQLVGFVFRSPLAARPLGGMWLCFRNEQSLADGANRGDRDDKLAEYESRLRSLLDALGALVSISRMCSSGKRELTRADRPAGERLDGATHQTR